MLISMIFNTTHIGNIFLIVNIHDNEDEMNDNDAQALKLIPPCMGIIFHCTEGYLAYLYIFLKIFVVYFNFGLFIYVM
jgi:hypothetical protein